MASAAEVAVVTGGARRIGRAIVRRLAEAGYAVAIHCHSSRTEAEALAADLVAAGGRAHVVEPIVQFAFAPDVNDTDIPNEDSVTVEFDQVNLFEEAAGLIQDDHPPRTGLVEGLRIVADQGGAQPGGLPPGFVEIAQQRAFRIGEVFRRDDLEPKPAHHALR